MLMLDKRAKRYVHARQGHIACPGRPLDVVNMSMKLISRAFSSALSMRIFGEDITTAAREAAAKKKQKSEATPDAEVDTPVLEDENAGTPVEEAEAAGAPEVA